MKQKLIYPAVILLIISVVINVVVIHEYLQQEGQIAEEQAARLEYELSAMEREITRLEGELSALESYQPASQEHISHTALERQEQYRETAEQFLEAYLTYSSSDLQRRYERLSEIAGGNLLALLTPTSIDFEDVGIPVGDAGFSSRLYHSHLYFRMNEHLARAYIVADVHYVMTDEFGTTELDMLYLLTLERDSAGEIRVMDFIPYSMRLGGTR